MLTSWIVLSVAIVLISVGIALIFWVKKSKKISLIPSGKIIYDDLHGSPSSLTSKKYPLIGKPDLILKKGWKRIPVEIKTGNHQYPKSHHVMQLLSYCQLAKENYRRPSPYGYLVYTDTNKRFKIQFTYKEKKILKSTIDQMQQILQTEKVIRNHHDKGKCNGCKMNSFCQAKIK
jgi:CRISPR-associated protein Cas4